MKPEQNEAAKGSESSTNALLCGGWQPIETAPTDGSVILVCGAYDHGGRENMVAAAARFRDGIWWRDNNGYGYTVSCSPTQWLDVELNT